MFPSIRNRWPRSRDFNSLLILFVLLIAIAVYRWIILSGQAAPPGSDGGNWLAFSAELFSGKIRAADAAYPPLFPLLLRFTTLFISPLAALKVLSILVVSCLSISAYLLLRTTLNSMLAALIAVAVVALDYNSEILAWGGYPQLLGATLVLLSTYFILLGLRTNRGRFVVISALTGGLAVASHILATVQLIIIFLTLLAIYAYRARRTDSQVHIRRLLWLALVWVLITIAVTAPAIPAYIRTLSLLGDSPLNPQQFSMLETFRNISAWRFEYYIWFLLAIFGSVFTLWAVVVRRYVMAEAALAFGVASVLGLVALSEIRSIHLLEIGILLCFGIMVKLAWDKFGPRLVEIKRRSLRYVLVAAIVIVACGVAVLGERRAQVAFNWYRVLDTDVLAALDWARDNSAVGDVAVANETPRGGIIGWWVEGYAGIPTFLAVDARWLVFTDERVQADIAHEMLLAETNSSEIQMLVQAHDIHILILHKETLENPVTELIEAGFINSYENDSMMVLTYDE